MNDAQGELDTTEAPASGPRVSPIITLDGQTTKQPVVWRCPNPECVEHKIDPVTGQFLKFFDFESDQAVCPKCGVTAPHVQKRALIHFLVKDKTGPIVGEYGIRYRMGCDAKRTVLATETNGEAATGDLSCANCPGCIKFVGDKIKSNGISLTK